MRRVPILLLLAGCSAEPDFRLSSLAGSSTPQSAAAVELGTDAALASYTTPWSDSVRQENVMIHSQGRVITTVAVHTDSQWTVGSPIHVGIPFGPTQLPPDSLCTLGYTATTLPVIPNSVLRS